MANETEEFTNFSVIDNNDTFVGEDAYNLTDSVHDVITFSEPYHQLLSLIFGDVFASWEDARQQCNSDFTQGAFAKHLLSLHSESCERCSCKEHIDMRIKEEVTV